MSAIEDGTYKAKVKNYWLGETKTKDLQVCVEFRFGATGEKNLVWFGGFSSDKASKRTVKTLETLGYTKSKNELIMFVQGPASNLLNLEKVVEIVVNTTEYNGQQRQGIDWVNEPGESGFIKLSQNEAATKLAGLNVDALFMKSEALPNAADDIPF